jgi:2-desacetyl-2-hydroxyethyl bacteriochlorophyllide A dehydrogenase
VTGDDDDATAFWVVEPGRGELRSEPLVPPGADEVLVRTLASGISRGTESLVFRGRVPAALHASMRCPFQAGDFPGPVKYGYAAVGVVEHGPRALEGRRVFCLHPHQDRFVVPAAAVLPVPDAVPTDRAVLAANAETAVNLLWDAPPAVGARIAVVGAGVVGCLAAWLAARVPGTEVVLVDTDPGRARIAAVLGVGFARPEEATGDRDLVIHASGAPAGLATALGLAGFEATVVEASWYGDLPVPAPLGQWFHPGRLRLVSSQVGEVAPSMRPRHTRTDRLRLALDLLDCDRLDALVTGESRFTGLPATMERLARAPAGVLCHLVRY